MMTNEYCYKNDTRQAQVLWLNENIIDVVWYADLIPIVKSFNEEDILKVGTIVKHPFGKKHQKLFDVKFLGLLSGT